MTSLPTLPIAKPKREEIAADKVLCEFCTAKCCRYFALPLETPTTREEFEYIRWFLLHEHATVFTEDGDWYVCVHTVCKHLQDDHRCGIYETRPQICREYTTKDCEYEDDWVYDQYFETPEQVAATAKVPTDPVWSSDEQALIALVDDLVDRRKIAKATWNALAAHFDEAQVLEAIALAGYYHTISFLCVGLELPLEPYGARFPS